MKLDESKVSPDGITRLDDFHLTGPEAMFLRTLPRMRRRAIMAAFRRKSFKERAEVIGRIKAEYKREAHLAAERARFRHSITGTMQP